MKNKKGILEVNSYIISGFFILFISLFVIMLYWGIYVDNIFTPLGETLNGLSNNIIGTQTKDNISNTIEFSSSYDWGWDFIFLLGLFYLIFEVINFALVTKSIPRSKFILILFGNFIIMGFVIYYVQDILSWFVVELIVNIFNLNAPFFNYVISNLGWLMMALITIALLINQIKDYVTERTNEVFRE